MKIAVACDPAGLPLKGPVEETLKELGVEYVDFGINDGDPRDYPIFAVRAANAVVSGQCDRGIILCGTGVGISMAANKVKGIRCCCCSDMGGRVIAPELAKMITEIWVKGEFEGGRHQRRIDMFKLIEEGKPLE